MTEWAGDGGAGIIRDKQGFVEYPQSGGGSKQRPAASGRRYAIPALGLRHESGSCRTTSQFEDGFTSHTRSGVKCPRPAAFCSETDFPRLPPGAKGVYMKNHFSFSANGHAGAVSRRQWEPPESASVFWRVNGICSVVSVAAKQLVPRDGVEPPTPAFSGLRSTT